MDIYTSCGWSERDAALSILQHNLFGLDIDRRAYQLAYFAVMMKARQYNRSIIKNGEVQPNLANFADVMGVDTSFVSGRIREFAEQFRFADTYGSLMKVTAPDDACNLEYYQENGDPEFLYDTEMILDYGFDLASGEQHFRKLRFRVVSPDNPDDVEYFDALDTAKKFVENELIDLGEIAVADSPHFTYRVNLDFDRCRHYQGKSASKTATYDRKRYLPAKILSVTSAVLFALYSIQMFAMPKSEWWNRFIVTDRFLENDPSVYKPIMGMGGLLLSVTAFILFLYSQKQSNGSANGKKLGISSVITTLIGSLTVNSIMFSYASIEFTVRLLPQSIIYTMIPLLCMLVSIISIRTRKYKIVYVTSVVAAILKIRPLLHISFNGLAALTPAVFSLAIISFSAATFVICLYESKQPSGV